MIISLGGCTNISHFWNMTIEIFYVFFFFLKYAEAEYQYFQHPHPLCGRCPIIFLLETKINYTDVIPVHRMDLCLRAKHLTQEGQKLLGV